MGGAALAQWGAGRIVGLFPAGSRDSAADAYTALFAALAALTVLALAVYRRAEDVRPHAQPSRGAAQRPAGHSTPGSGQSSSSVRRRRGTISSARWPTPRTAASG